MIISGCFQIGRLSFADFSFADIGIAHRIKALRLVPGLSVGVQNPAKARDKASDTYLVVRRNKTVLGNSFIEQTPLPPGHSVSLIYAARGDISAHLSDLLTLRLEGQLTYNENRTQNDPNEGARVFDEPLQIGVGFTAQARF